MVGVKAPSPHPLRRSCKDCGARVNEPCKNSNGDYLPEVHEYRYRFARKGNIARPTRLR